MKKTLTLATLLSTLYCSAQYADYYYDGNEQYSEYLYEFPGDSTRLLQARYVIGPGQYQEYYLEEITNGVLNPLVIPLCLQITSAPIEVDGGFVFSGLTANNGNE